VTQSFINHSGFRPQVLDVSSQIHVSFQHWQYEFSDDLLSRYGSPHFARNDAGSILSKEIYRNAVLGTNVQIPFSYEQILCGNEAFPEAAVADPIADLDVWNEWRSGTRYFPYPGRYSKLGITKQDDKISSPSSVGVLGEIICGIFTQAGISPWILVRVVRQWPDFICAHRNGLYSFIESKASTTGGLAGNDLQVRVFRNLLGEGAVDAMHQLNSDPFGIVWYGFTRVLEIDPMRLEMTVVELNATENRRRRHPVHVMPIAVVRGLAERALNQAAARLEDEEQKDLLALRGSQKSSLIQRLRELAEVELEQLVPDASKEHDSAGEQSPSDWDLLLTEVDSLCKKLASKKAKPTETNELVGRRFLKAKNAAAESRLSVLRRTGDRALLLADLPDQEVKYINQNWARCWETANKPWGKIDNVALWRCGGAVVCLGPPDLEGKDIRNATRQTR